jgi:hypothetical protein
MDRPARVRGVIRHADGSTHATSIELHRADRPADARPPHEDEAGETPIEASLDCGDDGSYKATLAAGRWQLVWRSDDGKEHSLGEWTLASGETKVIDLKLPAP